MANATYGQTTKLLLRDASRIKELYINGKSQREIGELYGCSRSLVNKFSKELGICGIITSSRCSGERNWNWKGGRSNSNGRPTVLFKRPDGSVKKQMLEHRAIAENALGRCLKKDETVHHINGDKTDNRNCNLLICSNSYHQQLEQKMLRLYKLEHFGNI